MWFRVSLPWPRTPTPTPPQPHPNPNPNPTPTPTPPQPHHHPPPHLHPTPTAPHHSHRPTPTATHTTRWVPTQTKMTTVFMSNATVAGSENIPTLGPRNEDPTLIEATVHSNHKRKCTILPERRNQLHRKYKRQSYPLLNMKSGMVGTWTQIAITYHSAPSPIVATLHPGAFPRYVRALVDEERNWPRCVAGDLHMRSNCCVCIRYPCPKLGADLTPFCQQRRPLESFNFSFKKMSLSLSFCPFRRIVCGHGPAMKMQCSKLLLLVIYLWYWYDTIVFLWAMRQKIDLRLTSRRCQENAHLGFHQCCLIAGPCLY